MPAAAQGCARARGGPPPRRPARRRPAYSGRAERGQPPFALLMVGLAAVVPWCQEVFGHSVLLTEQRWSLGQVVGLHGGAQLIDQVGVGDGEVRGVDDV